jgi:DNA-binding transcriptional MerR regulator
MAWSTREIAELSGTTVKTVRYYHTLGLLDEPDRKPNGYKQYQVSHLVRILQIKRLTALGVPLAQVATLEADPDGQAVLFRSIDAELEATVERLQGIRRELATLLQPGASADVPTAFARVAEGLRANDRVLLTIYAQLFSDESMDGVRQVLEAHPNTPLDEQFRDLPADADEATRQVLAEQIAQSIDSRVDGPRVELEPRATSPGGAEAANTAAGYALNALYNEAQLDVLQRAHAISRRLG